jgi:hypothetical protein
MSTIITKLLKYMVRGSLIGATVFAIPVYFISGFGYALEFAIVGLLTGLFVGAMIAIIVPPFAIGI